jgi:hypothetical protein
VEGLEENQEVVLDDGEEEEGGFIAVGSVAAGPIAAVFAVAPNKFVNLCKILFAVLCLSLDVLILFGGWFSFCV